MRQTYITPRNTEFVLLCFEGPDRYSLAGGLGVRIDNLSATLATMGFRTHLFFIGDPEFKGEEVRYKGKLTLHRWCQWISKYYPNGVYEGEDEKLYDFNESLPWFVKEHVVKPAVARGRMVVILGEEWHTAEAMCRLSDVLYADGLRDKVVMFWNANNTFSFHRINWGRLNYTTTITTVSRYMKHIMWRIGVNPLVIPNGIPRESLQKVDDALAYKLRGALDADLVMCKVARWDPDKRWNMAVEAVARLKQRGIRTVLLARGGVEPHGKEVLRNARLLGLTVSEARVRPGSSEGFLEALQELMQPIDTPRYILVRKNPIGPLMRKDYHAVPKVLARKKESAEYFRKMWARHVGPCELVYTRNAEGRRLLLKARAQSLSAAFQPRAERTRTWK